MTHLRLALGSLALLVAWLAGLLAFRRLGEILPPQMWEQFTLALLWTGSAFGGWLLLCDRLTTRR